jgi:Mn2+/Fe2+ NRAMP family transporter
MYWISKFIHLASRLQRRLVVLLAVLGPGLITMVADNDAGGISTYAVTGSKYGFSILWIFPLLVPIAYYVQEMTVRLGAVTKRGQAEVVFEAFGPFWGWFSLIDLAVINWLTLVTEFIGRYWTFEKLTLLFCAFNLVYIPAAFLAMRTSTAPGWGTVAEGLFLPQFPGGLKGEALFIILANIGTTITPWQIYFQQSAVVDKGLDIHDIRFGKADTLVGALLTCIVGAFIVVTTGAAFHYHHPPIPIQDAKQTAEALVPLLPHGEGAMARTLFAIGLFDAGFLGALCISLSTSWAVGEVFGWAHSLNRRIKDAPWFYAVYLIMLLSAGAIVLIPHAPLITITMFVQIVAVTLLPATLVFLTIILNDESFMGEYRNTRWQNVANLTIVGIVIALSGLFALGTLFPGLIGAGS